MAGKYLKSLVSGVVLPFNEAALKCADLRLMEPAECEEYEASMGINAAPPPKPAKKRSKKKASVKKKEASVDKVIAALEVD